MLGLASSWVTAAAALEEKGLASSQWIRIGITVCEHWIQKGILTNLIGISIPKNLKGISILAQSSRDLCTYQSDRDSFAYQSTSDSFT